MLFAMAQHRTNKIRNYFFVECEDDGKQSVRLLPRSNSLSLSCLAALLILFQLATNKLMLYRHLLTDASSYLHLPCQRRRHIEY